MSIEDRPYVGLYFEVNISARVLHWPAVCACCCHPSDAYYEASYTRTTGKFHRDTQTWNIPYCATCLRHVATEKKAAVYLGVAFVLYVLPTLAIVGVIMDLLKVQWFVTVVLYLFAVMLTFAWNSTMQHALKLMDKSCCTVVPAVEYCGWEGSIQQFKFASPVFAAKAIEVNCSKP